MKAFWASVILFGLLLIGIVGNAIYLCNSADQIRALELLLDEPSQRQENLFLLEESWARKQKIIALSVEFESIDRITEAISGLRWAYSTEEKEEFERYRILLLDAIDKMERAEKLSVENLF